jgi:hypothetical protein
VCSVAKETVEHEYSRWFVGPADQRNRADPQHRRDEDLHCASNQVPQSGLPRHVSELEPSEVESEDAEKKMRPALDVEQVCVSSGDEHNRDRPEHQRRLHHSEPAP